MIIIESRTDLETYIADTHSDLAEMGENYVEAVIDQIQFSDHPAWGEDWSEWLADALDPEFIETIVHGLDAIAPCRGADHGCSCGAPGCVS
jgi:hypothetical protein